MVRKGLSSALSALFVLLFAVAAEAQTPGIGAIRGRVLTGEGAPVASAAVTVTNEETGFSRTAQSDAQGSYVLPELPLTGTYRIHLFGRASYDQFTDTNPADAVGGVTLPSAARTFRRNTQALQVGETAVLGANAFNDARLVWEDGDPITQFDPASPSTQFVRPGVSTEGESRSAKLTNRQTQLADTVSLARGRHLLKLGGDVLRSKSGGNGQEFGSPFVLGSSPSAPASRRRSPPRS